MNPEGGGCSELRSCHCTAAWTTERDFVSKKRNPVVCHAICVSLKDIILSDISQTQKDKYCIISLNGILVELMDADCSMVAVRGWR